MQKLFESRPMKKGMLGGAQSMVLGLIVMAVTLVIGLSMLGILKDTQTADSLAYNATVATETAVDDVPTWFPLIVVAIMGSIALALVIRGMGR